MQIQTGIRGAEFSKLIKENGKKVTVYMSYKTLTDTYEQTYTYTNLNPKTIIAYVVDVSPEQLAYKQYGFIETGAKELICEDRYEEWLKNCSKLTIDDENYEVYKDGVGKRASIQHRPFNIIKVVIKRQT